MSRRQYSDVHGHLALLTDRSNGFLLDHAQQLDLHVQWQVRHLIQEQRATLGALHQAAFVHDGAGKAAALVPKSSLSISSEGMAPQFTGTNGPSARAPQSWIRRATSSLPVPDSPVM